MFDFGKLSRPTGKSRPTDPEEIFGKLPHLQDSPNDLWRGQATALSQWNEIRTVNDVLISLNTGAGKTLVGLLVAQSLVNEGLENVLYACSTIDLVLQTEREAKKLGINCTTRIKGGFSNDDFETGDTFCITTYAAIFNSLSIFSRRFRPEAIVFDDAHVAEKLLRDAFTLSIDKSKNADLFIKIARLFSDEFRNFNKYESFKDVINGITSDIIMTPAGSVRRLSNQISTIFHEYSVQDDPTLKYSYHYLKDSIDSCAVYFSRNTIEISPPFLPILTLPYFSESAVRRIYLSATLVNKSDFIRAFGRQPSHVIQPRNDAGNGERLIIFSSLMGRNDLGSEFVKSVVRKHKLVISVSSYNAAEEWSEFGDVPKREDFSQKLNTFRQSETGCFILVSRVDGIDLPHQTCRVMLIDDMPTGSTLTEKFQWGFLHMRNLFAAKIANRLTQLFGRINRGRNDYGVFLISGRELNIWLKSHRNMALFPELLQKQLLVGISLAQQASDMNNPDGVNAAMDAVLNRDEGWIEFYSDSIENLELDESQRKRSEEVESRIQNAAFAEVKFAEAIWDKDYKTARRYLEEGAEETARADSKLAGWHNLWIGICLEAEGDNEAAALEYRRARSRLGRTILIPIADDAVKAEMDAPETSFFRKFARLVEMGSEDLYRKEMKLIESCLAPLRSHESSSAQVEEAIRFFGELLGVNSYRPDNEIGSGPDVLWIDETKNIAIGFEAKSEKKPPAKYNKEDIGQGHNHLSWIKDNHQGVDLKGLLFAGPDGNCSKNASPSDMMYNCTLDEIVSLADLLVSTIRDIRTDLPLRRQPRVREMEKSGSWMLSSLWESLAKRSLRSMQPRQNYTNGGKF